MVREDVLEEILRRITDIPEEIEIEDSMAPGKTEGWDSLSNMELISEIENRFHIEFEFDELMQIDNWGDMKRIVINKTRLSE